MTHDKRVQLHVTRLLCSTCILPALLSLFVIDGAAAADGGRQFVATYDFGEATTVDPTHVSVPLSMELHNYSGATVFNATVLVMNRPTPGRNDAMLPTEVTVNVQHGTQLSAPVTIETREFQNWQRGARPNLRIRFTDSQGRRVTLPIEVLRMPGSGQTR